MSELVSELQSIYESLESFAKSFLDTNTLEHLNALERGANEVGKAWGHSWLGYQSHVYYFKLEPPPPGAHFSSEWGFEELYTMGTRGAWVQFPEEEVENEIRRRAGNPDITGAVEAAEKGRKFVEQKRDDVLSILRTAKGFGDDTFLQKLIEEAEGTVVPTRRDFIQVLKPRGDVISRDMIAITQGMRTPPHISTWLTFSACGHRRMSLNRWQKLSAVRSRICSERKGDWPKQRPLARMCLSATVARRNGRT